MRKFLRCTVLCLLMSAPALTAQTTAEEPNNCYTKWKNKFEERGAEEVKDGTYDDVIITTRNGSNATCYTGRAEVKAGKVTAMFLRLEDGSYEQVKKKLKFDVPMTITNGISAALLTMDDQLINVIFPKTLKPKKAGYLKAPEPADD